MTRQLMPNGREILFAYDSAGNLTSITPPSRPAHTFAYNRVDLDSVMTAPSPVTGQVQTQSSFGSARGTTRPSWVAG